MPTFEELQRALQAARQERETAGKSVSGATEGLRRVARGKEQALRSTDRDSREWQSLLRRESQQKERLATERARLEAAVAAENRLVHEFEQFTDPRRELSRLSDDLPILLLPVRIETRFKTIQRAGAAPQHQLWVRVFPDDCSIDSFDDTLSEAEVKMAQNYWTNRWKTGTPGGDALKDFVREKDRGTWRELMGSFNPGRAHWIREQYVPLNPGGMPVRSQENETILVIPTDNPPDQATQDALRDYWTAVFLANADAAEIAAALAALMATLGIGEEEATSLVQRYRPDSFEVKHQDEEPAPPVQVVFLAFPPGDQVDTKLNAWSRASRVTTLPERFVLLGFQADRATPVINQIGALIPPSLIVGPDPSIDIEAELRAIHGAAFDTFTDDEKAERYIEYLAGRSETRWLFDFDEALRVGMGFKVGISQAIHDNGLERLFVLGVKLGAAGGDGQAALEQLLAHHHFGESGLSILPQGTPTNNTENSKSGYAESADPDEAYDNYHRDVAPDDPTDDRLKRDGRWLADMLGIDADESSLNLVPGYYLTDQREARAMNTALWNATLGYFMESMMTPVFTEWQRHFTRWFLIQHVSGRGRLAAIRIGDQPYGILPATNLRQMRWFDRDDVEAHRLLLPYRRALRPLHSLLQKMREDWSASFGSVAYIGKRGQNVDAHALLLQALGLHPTSVEFDQRYAESFLHHFNWLVAMGRKELVERLEDRYREYGLELLTRLGYIHDPRLNPEIPILERYFLTKENDVTKPLIDDRELSESSPIRAYTDLQQNYIEWLIDRARTDHRDIRDQKGFTGNKPPYALLYDMLRHALNLQVSGTVLNLYQAAEILNESQLGVLRKDAEFIGVRAQPVGVESRWDLIYQSDVRIAENGALLVDHVSDLIRSNVVTSPTRNLHEMLEALELLKQVPTARLERVFVEHLDLCTYRLDAWLLGLIDAELHTMRYQRGRTGQGPRQGIHIGAFAWVEDLKPDGRTLTPARLSPELKESFDPDGTRNPMVDSANAGYVHAPSINHALTAAVLRNAYISRASAEAAEPYKVNLSSERVRNALAIIEGMQQGQSLGALLGYRLERGLHDNTAEELDSYIYELRKVFPLRSNKLLLTQVKVGKPADTPADAERNQEEEEALTGAAAVTKIEARNVVDGLALLDHIRKTDEDTYPFGFEIGDGPDKLKGASPGQRAAIDAEIQRLMNVRDAVADLAMAESVHQVVQGNYDRAAGALDAYSKGQYPQLPDVIRSPGSGISLTHRFGIHLQAGVAPVAGDSPRARMEPAVNRWIKDLLPPDLSKVACLVEYSTPTYDAAVPAAVVSKTVTMEDLGLSPIDLLYLLNVETDKGLTALDDYVIRFVDGDDDPPRDIDLSIRYAHTFVPGDDILSFFEVMPLIDSLRTLVLSSRALLPADMAVPNEARQSQNASAAVDPARLAAARQRVLDLLDDLEADVVTPLEALIDDEDFEVALGNQAALIAQADNRLDRFVAHLNELSRFGILEAGFGFVYDRRRAIHAAVRTAVAEYRNRWRERRDQYDDLIDNQLPAATTDEERYRILADAERLVSTVLTVPPPAIPVYTGAVTAKRSDFDDKLDDFDTFLTTHFATFQQLFDAVDTLTADLADFDPTPLDVEDEERQTLVLVEDLFKQARDLIAAKRKRMDEVQDLIDDAAASGKPPDKLALHADAAKALFGEEFLVIPEFTLSGAQGAELAKCFADRAQLLDHQTNTLGAAFPVDDWLYGVARVREKLAAWENLVVVAEGLRNRPPIDLTPLQLPYAEDDHWLGLAWPEGLTIPNDKLLYTAYLPAFNPAGPQCGLLVDEWTEVIPAKTETTGLTFHFDRPNTEPPQAMLLVTPPAFTGAWQWGDVVAAMHETLDLARLRAIEPDHVDAMPYAQFLPATVAASTAWPVTMALNFAMASDRVFQYTGGDNA
jgi:hypothetical protein